MDSYTAERAVREAAEIINEFAEGTGIQDLKFSPGDPKGDISFACFAFAKKQKKNPSQISNEICSKITLKPESLFTKVESLGGYINFHLDDRKFLSGIIDDFSCRRDSYGRINVGENKTAIIDYSSPNIAKPFSIGHLRSTNIGASLCSILRFAGYTVIGDNHLGDWGTQFGKLIYAYKNWGKREDIERDPIKELLKLYVRFHEEAGLADDEHPEAENKMEQQARDYFKQLEDGDEEMNALWKWIKEISLQDFKKVYDMLGVTFEEMLGESFYNDKMEEIKTLAESKGILETDEEGTKLVRLDEYGISTPLLLQKKDGASLYATRDLAGILYRQRRWNPDIILYVVGEEQQLYFKQLLKTAELLGIGTKCEHIQFGLMTMPAEGKFSTRKGRVIFLEDVLNEAKEKVTELISDRDLSDEKKKKISEVVGIGAVKYNDLSQNRKKTVTFAWDKMLATDGNSSPYLQYSYSRARAVIRKAGYNQDMSWDSSAEISDEEKRLIYKLSLFPKIIESAVIQFYPHIISNWLFETAQDFTSFYTNIKILSSEGAMRQNRLILTDFYSTVIKSALKLLGVGVLEEM